MIISRAGAAVNTDSAELNAAPVHAINVRSYAYKNSSYRLPAKVDIRLANSFRVCAPVTWENEPVLTEPQEQVINGTAVYKGKSYSVKAYVTVL